MPVRPNEIIIDDSTNPDLIFNPFVDGERKGMGCVPRDLSVQPREMFEPPGEIKVYPRSEWSARVKEKVERGSLLSLIRLQGNKGQAIPSINQGQSNYCWGHSTVQAVIINRAKSNEPYVPLSAFGVCAMVMQGQNKGGWAGLSAKFMRERGIPSQAKWPQGDFSYQKYANKQDVWDDAKKRIITEEWVDLNRQPWDQKLTFEQLFSLLIDDEPCPIDLMWWLHSVLALDPVEIESNSFGVRIWNSWGDSWGDRGMSVLRENKATPDDALCIRAISASDT